MSRYSYFPFFCRSLPSPYRQRRRAARGESGMAVAADMAAKSQRARSRASEDE